MYVLLYKGPGNVFEILPTVAFIITVCEGRATYCCVVVGVSRAKNKFIFVTDKAISIPQLTSMLNHLHFPSKYTEQIPADIW